MWTWGCASAEFYGQGELDRAAEARVAFWLERLGIDSLHETNIQAIFPGGNATGGIARTNSDVLLMDEPFSSLDALTREDLRRVVLDLRKRWTSRW